MIVSTLGIILIIFLVILLSPILFMVGWVFVWLISELFYEWMCANRTVYKLIINLWRDE